MNLCKRFFLVLSWTSFLLEVSMAGHAFHPECQDFQAFFITSLEREPLGLSTTTLHKDNNIGCSYVTKEIQADNANSTASHRVEYNALFIDLSSWRWKRTQWLQTSLKCLHLLIYKTMSTGLYTMQLAQFNFIQWTDNSGSKILFCVPESEKEQLWKSVGVQLLKVIYWKPPYRKRT